MGATRVDVSGESFVVNGKLTYSDIPGSHGRAHGLLMNARFIQGIFDDRAHRERFARFGMETYDPEANTDALIAALPQWYEHGLRAFTVGLQGGGPCFTIRDLCSIDNNPFGEDGRSFDPSYEGRLDRLIQAADRLGMLVIVSYLYQGQALRLRDGRAVRNAIDTASAVLRNGGYTNVIVEVANEHTVGRFANHPLVSTKEGAAYLVDRTREKTEMPVGCSGGGGEASREVNEAADIILIHGNGCTRQQLYNTIKKARAWGMDKPIVCNEDSQCVGQLAVTYPNYASWGYYNNMTKQEPPAEWGITRGEDQFFAYRMAEGIGIAAAAIPADQQYFLQGFEPAMEVDGKRWIRLASLYPETIDFVEFVRNGSLYDIAYDEPFSVNFLGNWMQDSVSGEPGDRWEAKVHLRSGEQITKTAVW